MSQRPFEVIRGPEVPESHLPFSPAVKAGEYVFVSGQASVDASGQIVNGTFEEEMRRSLENVRSVLAGAGLSLADVVQVRNYVADQDDLETFNRVYREFFTEPFPARTTIMGCLGSLLKYEVDVVAYAGK